MSSPVPAALRRPEPVALTDRLTWSVSEVAQATGLSARTIQAAIYRGDLPAIHIGRRVLLSPDAVRSWLESQQSTSAPLA